MVWLICLFTLSHTFAQKFFIRFDFFYGSSFVDNRFIYFFFDENQIYWNESLIERFLNKLSNVKVGFVCEWNWHFRIDWFDKCVNELNQLGIVNLALFICGNMCSRIDLDLCELFSIFTSIIRLKSQKRVYSANDLVS